MPYDRDQLGFLKDQRCPHCSAPLYLSEEAEAKGMRPICLNGCTLQVWQKRLLDEGLKRAMASIDAAAKQEEEEHNG